MLKKYFLLLSVLETDADTETVLLKICVETMIYFSGSIEYTISKKSIYLEYKSFVTL